jgi:alkanesulfonate monooxygenase SsuD/methylene tetrahydromethanopterin reductase-like flavin-dependent oxidoreductase (luciferase family)
MHRDKPLSIQEIKDMSKNLEDLGYKSLLLVVNTNDSDNWIKVANAIDPNQKIKYLIALRPYMISPSMCAMMVRSFNEISPNRLGLNVVSGQILKDEYVVDKHLDLDIDIQEVSNRLKYVSKFLKDFSEIEIESGKPEILVGTGNNNLIKDIKKYTDISLCMYDDFKKNDFSNFKRKMVSIQIVLRDTKIEADEFMNKFKGTRQEINTIYGTKETLIKKIMDLEHEGITDVLISLIPGDKKSTKGIEIVRDILRIRQNSNIHV